MPSVIKENSNPKRSYTVANVPPPQKQSPKKPLTKPEAKESPPQPKVKKLEQVAPKIETNTDSVSPVENEINSVSISTLL